MASANCQVPHLKGTMNLFTRIVIVAGLLVASISSVAQNAGAAKPGAPLPNRLLRQRNGSLPSEATFDSFLKKMFGWNTELSLEDCRHQAVGSGRDFAGDRRLQHA